MKQLLSLPVTDCEQWNDLAALGIDPEDIDNQMLVTVGLWRAAVDGDVKAYREMRHLIGEGETDLDRKIKRAQLEKIKAETESLKKSGNDKIDSENNLMEILKAGGVDDLDSAE